MAYPPLHGHRGSVYINRSYEKAEAREDPAAHKEMIVIDYSGGSEEREARSPVQVVDLTSREEVKTYIKLRTKTIDKTELTKFPKKKSRRSKALCTFELNIEYYFCQVSITGHHPALYLYDPAPPVHPVMSSGSHYHRYLQHSLLHQILFSQLALNSLQEQMTWPKARQIILLGSRVAKIQHYISKVSWGQSRQRHILVILRF